MSPPYLSKRNVSLDGIRGIAIALVIVHHTIYGAGATSYVTILITRLAGSCWVGVDLFFVLSGYLITGILLKSRDHPGYFRIFYMRRCLRIFPLYYFCLLSAFLVIAIFKSDLVAKLDLSWNLFYLANLRLALHGWAWRPVSHLWSLAVEEQFYLVWPTMIFLMPRRHTFAVIVGLFCAFVAIRQGMGLTAASHQTLVFGMLHLDGLSCWAPHWPPCDCRCLLQLMQERSRGLYRGLNWRAWEGVRFLNYSLVAGWGSALIAVSIYSHAGALINRLLAFRPLVEMGKYSYAIYVLHYPLDTALHSLNLHPLNIFGTILYALFLGCASFALALGTWKLIEERFINLKDRWFAYEAAPARDLSAVAGVS